ncbi:peptide-methionine (S)-S-oxide reductase MsrA [Natronomonas gomsonensis]|uniref:peptide-methionine (S)-S-oxide reductase MsrA n=1 Tax=Natronomonas gomsonensis TaxID=1046043 RepID=UPI0020CA784E|nr:peptide-methionine (S)-S-oxide reductase MsrA [Natronomonas gomsonensis]MCY4731299.1 peptide-methionine (S)-S-oxide reductase MsrA [Natronomonas gomsonensis]
MTETATLAGGCFWCIEAALKELDGVASVVSGYAGGHVEDPTYEAVCREETGHAEAVQVEFDPETISYRDLLEVFFTIHDPTQLNRQGPDIGTQYRSAVFYHDDEQRDTVESVIEDLQPLYDDDIVTEVEPLDEFYRAEEYHQDYFEKNPNDTYCVVNINPKLKEIREKHAALLAD